MDHSLVFFGNEQLSSSRTPTTAPALRGLIKAGYTIEALIIKQRPQLGRRRRQTAVLSIAEDNNIPVHQVIDKEELITAVSQMKSKAAVLAAFGMIIPQAVIDHFNLGIINIHPSLLPAYRGTTPIESAILNGDTSTGVSLMCLSAEMDAGGIYAQETLSLTGDESKSHLTEALSEMGARLLVDNLDAILGQELKPKDQIHQDATFTDMLSKQLSEIDWHQPAKDVERRIRAYADWPGSKTTINDTAATITAAHSTPSNTPRSSPGDVHIDTDLGAIMFECTDGILCIDRLKPAGKGEMSAIDYINGYL